MEFFLLFESTDTFSGVYPSRQLNPFNPVAHLLSLLQHNSLAMPKKVATKFYLFQGGRTGTMWQVHGTAVAFLRFARYSSHSKCRLGTQE